MRPAGPRGDQRAAASLVEWLRGYALANRREGASLAEIAASLGASEQTAAALIEAWCGRCGAARDLYLCAALIPGWIWICRSCRDRQLGLDPDA